MARIVIDNYKMLKHIDVELDHSMLIIGEQASGKSTFSKLVYFFKSLREEYMFLIVKQLLSGDELREKFQGLVKANFINAFGSTRHLRKRFNVRYYFASDDNYFQLTNTDVGNLSLYIPRQYQQKLYYNIDSYVDDLRSSDQSNILEVRRYELFVNQLNAYVNSLFDDSRQAVFIPASRNIVINYPEMFNTYSRDLSGSLSVALEDTGRDRTRWEGSLPNDAQLMLEFVKRVDLMRAMFRNGGGTFGELVASHTELGFILNEPVLRNGIQMIEQILKGRYRVDSFGERIYFNEDEYVHLVNASSGQQEVVSVLQDIFLILLEGQSVFRVIEEPEAHLYPMAQKYLIYLLASMINATESQVIITTHSPYILTIINNLWYARNVGHSNGTQLGAQVAEIIPQQLWLSNDNLKAYQLYDGKLHTIITEENLIGENALDEASENIGDDFEEILSLYLQSRS